MSIQAIGFETEACADGVSFAVLMSIFVSYLFQVDNLVFCPQHVSSDKESAVFVLLVIKHIEVDTLVIDRSAVVFGKADTD